MRNCTYRLLAKVQQRCRLFVAKFATFAELLGFLTAAALMALPPTCLSDAAKDPDRPIDVNREWGKVMYGFQMSLWCQMSVYDQQEPIVLSIALKNVSEKILFTVMSSTVSDFELVVAYPDGKPVPLTKRGEELLHGGKTFLFDLASLKPGDQRRFSLKVTELYDMSSPGKYTVSAKRWVYDESARPAGKVTSNTLKIEVKARK